MASPSSSPKDMYLMLYNGMCCAGWAVVFVSTVSHVMLTSLGDFAGVYHSSSDMFGALAPWLQVAQTAALLEIVHAALGLVRSPVIVTFLQVSSRIVALIAVVYSQKVQAHWGNGLMILSWSMVEVPRYAFYLAALITGDATKKTPYPLFWLRYSLFAFLYPSGVAGELACFWNASQDQDFVETLGGSFFIPLFYGTLLFLVYLLGFPFMFMNMVNNRKSAFKKRFAKPPPPARGLCWPQDSKGERSSTAVNQAILAAAVGAVNDTKAKAILNSRGWRFSYNKHLKALVEEQCISKEACLKIATAGLEKAYDTFEFIYDDGTAVSFRQAMNAKKAPKPYFQTMRIQGMATNKKVEELEVPYKGQTLKGQALKDQVMKWVSYGTIEPSAGEAICKCVDNPEWLSKNALQNRYFVLLGAGSAMGPLLALLSIGANVIAVDLDRPAIWQRLITLTRNSAGSITFPVKVPDDCVDHPYTTLKTDEQIFAAAGANLFTHTPMIRDWLVDLYPGKPFTVGSYAYLNGALHVQVSLAMDAICRDLTQQRGQGGGAVSLAYLCTPTDLHLVPKEANEAALANYKEFSQKLYCIIFRALSTGKLLRKNAPKPIAAPSKSSSDDASYYLCNGISVAQGPNYALAKRLQHWRAIVAHQVQGCVVSSNIAPSTSTVSVVQNRTFAWAYEGMPYFKPYEIFAPETSNAVMSAILMYDLNEPNSIANPQNTTWTKNVVNNPNQLFSYGSFHGGTWRCAYEIDSIGEASVFLYFGRLAQPYIMAVSALAAAGAAVYFGMASSS